SMISAVVLVLGCLLQMKLVTTEGHRGTNRHVFYAVQIDGGIGAARAVAEQHGLEFIYQKKANVPPSSPSPLPVPFLYGGKLWREMKVEKKKEKKKEEEEGGEGGGGAFSVLYFVKCRSWKRNRQSCSEPSETPLPRRSALMGTMSLGTASHGGWDERAKEGEELG
ncbi:hypothetical protein L3Q82_013608, partial [Scortum barcoo]